MRGGTPDYFGANPNYALSQLPTVDTNTGMVVPGTGIRKFVDSSAWPYGRRCKQPGPVYPDCGS